MRIQLIKFGSRKYLKIQLFQLRCPHFRFYHGCHFVSYEITLVTKSGVCFPNTRTYLGSRLQGDGDAKADVRYRMDIAQAAFASLSHLWTDHRLSRNLKLRLYNLCACSTLTHSCEAWNLTKAVSRILNGFNSRCLHVITGEEYRVTAVSPAYNLLLSVRQRRLRYLGHLLRLPHDSVVRRTLIAMAGGGNRYPEGSASSWTARVQN